ncbi:tetratricopeptide repeat protein [Candidatus Latescibacterota bacterium]
MKIFGYGKVRKMIYRFGMIMVVVACLKVMTSAVHADGIVTIGGSADVVMDGDLSDWGGYGSDAFRKEIAKVSGREDSNDKPSPLIRCFADSGFIYVAVDVRDDMLTFEDVSSRQIDGIMLYFCNENKEMLEKNFRSYRGSIPKPPLQSVSINISADGSGNTIKMFYHGNNPYPYVSDELGVKTALKRTGEGYAVECAIPLQFLNLAVPGEQPLNAMYIDIIDGNKIRLDNRYMRTSKVGLNSVYPERDTLSQAMVSDVATIYEVFGHFSTAKWAEAEAVLISAGNSLWVSALLVRALHSVAKYDEEINTLKSIVRAAPDAYARFWALRKLSERYMATNRYMGNSKDFDAAESVNREFFADPYSILYGEAVYNLIKILLDKSEYESAYKIYDSADKDRLIDNYRYIRIASEFRRKWDFEKAGEVLLDGIASAAEMSAHIQKGVIDYTIDDYIMMRMNSGNKSKALRKIRELIDTYPDYRVSARLADFLELMGKYDEALDIYDEILQTTDEDYLLIEARAGAARVHYFNGDYDRALEMSEELIAEDLLNKETDQYSDYYRKKADAEARIMKLLVIRARIMHKIYLALITGVILIMVLRLYLKKHRNVISA